MFQDYSDSFEYAEKIVLDYAKQLCKMISDEVIKTFISLTEGLQSGCDSGLTNLWQEISVQLQSQFSIMWDLYDDMVENEIEKRIRNLPDFALAAIQYSIDFSQSDSDYEYRFEDIIGEIKSEFIYQRAANNHEKAVQHYLDSSCEMD